MYSAVNSVRPSALGPVPSCELDGVQDFAHTVSARTAVACRTRERSLELASTALALAEKFQTLDDLRAEKITVTTTFTR